jgi:hypothetical protein
VQPHSEKETHSWEITIPGHAPRKDSAHYRHSAETLKKLVALAPPGIYGPGPAECHHGGALWAWTHDDVQHGVPFMVFNLAGIEWSAQFCAAPYRVDLLRVNAFNFYTMYPNSLAALETMGCEAYRLIGRPIVDAIDVAAWVDSIFNASVPYPKEAHVGVLPDHGGAHHYPKPITDIEFFKREDFVLWVDDLDGVKVAVVPVAPPGSGCSEVALVYVPPHSMLHPIYASRRVDGELVVLPETHPLTRAAFAKQQT